MSESEYTQEWCRQFYAKLAPNGTWAVPRSGLVFTKRDGKLVLTARLPWKLGMPGNARALYEYQVDDFEAHRREFGAAGIEVVDGTGEEVIDKVEAEVIPMRPLDGSRRASSNGHS